MQYCDEDMVLRDAEKAVFLMDINYRARSFAGRVMTAPQFYKDSHALNTLFVDNEETKINVGGNNITRDGYGLIMDDMGAKLIGSIRKYVGTGLEPCIVFDNLDFKILANVILQNHRNSHMHWIAHFLTFDRVSSENLDDSKPQKANVEDFELVEYLLNKSELEKLCSDFIVLVARVLAEFFSFMATLGGSVIPKHISHWHCKYIY